MNWGLFVFSVLLIFGGVLLGNGFLPLIGVFLLIASLLTSRSPSRPSQGQTSTQPLGQSQIRTRSQGPFAHAPAPAPAPSPMEVAVPMTSAPPPSGYEQRTAAGNPSLFPSTMFPSFGPIQQPAQTTVEAGRKEIAPQSRDELLELVALMAIVKLVSR